VYMKGNSEALFSRARASTGEDLADLFALGRALSEASTTSGLITALIQRVSERFDPDAICVALHHPTDAKPTFFPPGSDGSFADKYPVLDMVEQVAAQQRGVLIPESCRTQGEAGMRTTAASPIVLGNDVIGALVVQTQSPRHIYDESDLEFLLAQALTAAPYFRAIERMELLERENRRLVAGAAEGVALVGESDAMNRVRSLAKDCARSGLNALVLGETGTGKELVVRMIHRLSGRAEPALTVVNCAAIPAELLESELFGYERGAFTGAHAQKKGLFEECDGGTLFLDELCDLSPPNQARLLRVIENGVFRRLGGKADITVNVRVIAATNKPIAEEVDGGRFRRDLYHRLNTFEIVIPPLRLRRDDIPILAKRFHRVAQERLGYRTIGFTPEAIDYLTKQPWQGNVRELRNVVERAMVVAPYDAIRPEDLQRDGVYKVESDPKSKPFLTLAEMEKSQIVEALRRCDGNVKVASAMLDIGRSTLYRKLDEYGLRD
ncbi:MAG: sigma-54-dependent Fis family transcriptional regulator, partial [Candidatus Hydrogenedentes bacterium]|nr:sigma-54-dependent Fis family transcriptional regulator [Candidatus Hydrogenedentota bacterium]